jgi:predicted dehydrogenase
MKSSRLQRKIRVGVIGCGNIAQKAYLPNLLKFPHLEVTALADLDPALAGAQAARFGVPRSLTPVDLLRDPRVDLVVNLTIPQAHVAIDIAALKAGKHVFSEKPFALTRTDARKISRLARSRKLRVGCAPDTVLGAGIQTCRKIIDQGDIGTPIAFTANMLCGGHESWHPSPEFYYQPGGGPLWDMGPYYLHALITLLGPIARLSAAARTTHKTRTITSQPKSGKKIRVEVPTHLTALLETASGVTGVLTTSFDICVPHTHICIEIHGTEGSLKVPDPNTFAGPVYLGKPGKEWQQVPLIPGYAENTRGLGAADMAAALATGRSHRANDSLALHATDIMQAVHESADKGRRIDLTTTCKRPAPMPAGLPLFTLD